MRDGGPYRAYLPGVGVAPFRVDEGEPVAFVAECGSGQEQQVRSGRDQRSGEVDFAGGIA